MIHHQILLRQAKTHFQTLDTLRIMYGDAMMSRTMIYHRYEAFERGREIAAKDRPGAPCRVAHKAISNTAAIIIQEKLTRSLKQLATVLPNAYMYLYIYRFFEYMQIHIRIFPKIRIFFTKNTDFLNLLRI